MKENIFVTPDQFRYDSLSLAKQVWDSDYRPSIIIPVLRGGATPANYVDSFLKRKGSKHAYHALRTSKYDGVNKAREKVRIHGLGFLKTRVKRNDRILIVDDVYDTGLSLKAVSAKIREFPEPPQEIRIATVYWKPDKNQTERKPDFLVHSVQGGPWIVFPHEIDDCSDEEIRAHFGKDIADLVL